MTEQVQPKEKISPNSLVKLLGFLLSVATTYLLIGLLVITLLAKHEASVVRDVDGDWLAGFTVVIWPLMLLIDGGINIGLRELGDIVRPDPEEDNEVQTIQTQN